MRLYIICKPLPEENRHTRCRCKQDVQPAELKLQYPGWQDPKAKHHDEHCQLTYASCIWNNYYMLLDIDFTITEAEEEQVAYLVAFKKVDLHFWGQPWKNAEVRNFSIPGVLFVKERRPWTMGKGRRVRN